MSENKLLDMLKKAPDKYARQLSNDDLRAVRDNNPKGMSVAGLKVIQAGSQDLGKGEFIDLGTSIAGAMSGAAIGSMAGPVGTFVGGAVGGALGAFGGEVLEDSIAGRDVNVGFGEGGAGREAVISGGIDMATLGLGRVIRLSRAARAATYTNKELGAELAPALAEVRAIRGSGASAAQSTEILRASGLDLSPMAMQGANMFTKISHAIGEIGMLSRGKFAEDVAARESVFFDELGEFTQRAGAETLDKTALGTKLWSTIETGRQAASEIYGLGLNDIGKMVGKKEWLSGAPVQKELDKFLNTNTIAVKADRGITGKITKKSSLDTRTQKVAAEMSDMLTASGTVGKFRLGGLLEAEKIINRHIQDAMPTSGTGNSVVLGELMDMHKSIRTGVTKVLSNADSGIASKYQLLQKSYSDSQDALFPNINSEFVKKAVDTDYNAVGNLLLSSPQPKKIKKLMASIVQGHSLAGKAAKLRGETYDVAAKSKESIDTVRASFVNELTSSLNEGDRMLTKGFVTKLFKPENQAQYRAIFGDDFNGFKKLINLASDLTPRSSGAAGIGSLAFRSQEFSKGVGGVGNVMGNLVTAGVLGGASALTFGGAVGGLATAAAIFSAPSILYKLARNPSTVNKLLALNNNVLSASAKGGDKQGAEVMVAGFAKIVNAMPELEKAQLVDEMQKLGISN